MRRCEPLTRLRWPALSTAFVLLASWTAWPAESPPTLEGASHALYSVLPGTWDGEAVITPVGPVNYDLEFFRCPEGWVAGTAATNASLHFWRLHPLNGLYKIRFLSTFAGNREPVWLEPDRFSQGALWFKAPKLELLALAITVVSRRQLQIDVYHHDEHHVRIRLQRDSSGIFLLRAEQNRTASCRGHPD